MTMNLTWLTLSAFLQFGSLNGAALMYDRPSYLGATYENVPPLYGDIGIRAEAFDHFFVAANVRTNFWVQHLTNYNPFEMDYTIEGGLRLGPLTVGIRHTCYHPVAPYSFARGYQVIPRFEGATNDIYMRIEISNK